VRVRIIETPQVREVDGVQLGGLRPGFVGEISASLATWLIAERYADPEMRHNAEAESAESVVGATDEMRRQVSTKGPRRRADDR
jgi:hypothetical protein